MTAFTSVTTGWATVRYTTMRDSTEQRVDEPQLPDMVAVWEARWGTAADPLLWSHAKYLLMETESELDGQRVVER